MPPDEGRLLLETMMEMNRKVGGMDEGQRRLEVDMAGLSIKLDGLRRDLAGLIDEHDKRIGSLERSRAHLKGMLAPGATGTGILGGVVARLFDKWFS